MRNLYVLQRFCLGVLMVIYGLMLNAQIELVGTPYHTTKSSNQFQENFTSYNLFQIDINGINRKTKNQDDLIIKMSIGKSIRADAVLFKNDLLPSNYSVITDGGENLDIDKNQLAQHFEGYILDDPNSEVRLSFADGYIYGYIQQDNQRKYIEPASTFDKQIAENTFVIYSPTDVKTSGKNYCASKRVEQKIKKTESNLKSAVDCGILEIAIALDNSYVLAYGNNEAAINQSISILNMVEPNYNSNAFSKNVKFSIVQHFIPTGADPWTTSADAAVLLNAFTSWGAAGFSATHDIGEFWTNRDLYFIDAETGAQNNFVAGLAWVGTVCAGAKYHILEDFTSTAWQLRVLTAHEMGHNFGADHDSASGNIMAGSITQNTNSWSTLSIGAIDAKLEDYNCLEECFQGSCSSITSISTSDCAVDQPSTYTLTIELTHGGGEGDSQGFNVTVDGGTYFQSWSTSPQTVVITGLTSNGTLNQSITILADDGSDSDCNGSGEFNEPRPDCELDVEENFNNCQIPNGWTSSSTLTTAINNGDPFVQYQWKFLGSSRTFGNYDSYSNASTTKTIDGTCMAIMDDDIFSSSGYSGTVTLETSTYDVGDYVELILEFDYLFHPFEDGGKGSNNSYFRVEVWDGAKYVSLLNDQDSECPWSDVWDDNCIDNASINVTSYLNPDFKVKFTFSDAASWAGMAAVDNFKLIGTPPSAPESDCDSDRVVSGGEDVSGQFTAAAVLQTEGNVILTGPTMFMAESIELTPGFEVGAGIEFTAQNGDCNTY